MLFLICAKLQHALHSQVPPRFLRWVVRLWRKIKTKAKQRRPSYRFWSDLSRVRLGQLGESGCPRMQTFRLHVVLFLSVSVVCLRLLQGVAALCCALKRRLQTAICVVSFASMDTQNAPLVPKRGRDIPPFTRRTTFAGAFLCKMTKISCSSG